MNKILKNLIAGGNLQTFKESVGKLKSYNYLELLESTSVAVNDLRKK